MHGTTDAYLFDLSLFGVERLRFPDFEEVEALGNLGFLVDTVRFVISISALASGWKSSMG